MFRRKLAKQLFLLHEQAKIHRINHNDAPFCCRHHLGSDHLDP